MAWFTGSGFSCIYFLYMSFLTAYQLNIVIVPAAKIKNACSIDRLNIWTMNYSNAWKLSEFLMTIMVKMLKCYQVY